MHKSPAFSTSFLESRMIQKLKSRKSRIKPGLFAFLLAERIIFGKKTQKSSRAPCGPGWIFRECGIRTREGTRQVSLTLNLLGQEARQGFLRRGETGPTRLRVGVRASSVSQKRWSIPPAQPRRGESLWLTAIFILKIAATPFGLPLLPAKSLVCSGCSLASAVATPPLH